MEISFDTDLPLFSGLSQANNFCAKYALSIKTNHVFFTSAAGAIAGGLIGLAGGIIGAVIGAFIGGALAFTITKIYDAIQTRKLLTPLHQIREQIPDDRIKRAVNAVIHTFSSPAPKMKQVYEHHTLHIHLTDITEAVKQREDLKKIWGTFLTRVQGTPIQYPDGRCVPFNTEFEQMRLQNRLLQIQVDEVQRNSPRFQQDFEGLVDVDQDTLVGTSIRNYLTYRFDTQHARCLVARQLDTGRILGYLMYNIDNNNNIYVMELQRKAGAAKLGIGEALFHMLEQREEVRGRNVTLHVRASNQSAHAIYERLGFRDTERMRNYYQLPVEDAILMTRPIVQAAQQAV